MKNILRKARSFVFRTVLPSLPAKMHLSLLYYYRFRRFPNWSNPVTFTEKVQWTKIYARDPSLPQWADKAKAKELVADILGEEWIVPTHFAGKHLSANLDIPTPFVVKPTHSSGRVILVRDKPDWARIEREASKWLTETYGAVWGEWVYDELEPGIIIEEMLGDGKAPPDYKFYVFNGRVQFVHVDTDRAEGHKRVIFDRDWNRQPFTLKYPNDPREIPKPKSLDRMIEAAERIGSRWSFARVDFYDPPGHPKFGEVTFFPDAGLGKFSPPGADAMFGAKWTLSR